MSMCDVSFVHMSGTEIHTCICAQDKHQYLVTFQNSNSIRNNIEMKPQCNANIQAIDNFNKSTPSKYMTLMLDSWTYFRQVKTNIPMVNGAIRPGHCTNLTI